MTGPSKQRPGDQILPDAPERGSVQDRIIADMQESKRVGIERYGQTLQTFNGRRGLRDIQEEARDLFVYLTQVEMEGEASRDELIAVVTAALWGTEVQNARTAAIVAVDRVMGWVTARTVGTEGNLGSVCQRRGCNNIPVVLVQLDEWQRALCVAHGWRQLTSMRGLKEFKTGPVSTS